MIISCDFGHSSIKATNGEKEIIFPSILSEDVKTVNPNDLLDNFDPVDYMRVKFERGEYFVGNLAKKQSRLCMFSHNDEDALSEQTKLLIYTAAAYLMEDSADKTVKLVTTLPVSHSSLREEFKDMLYSPKHSISMSIYDYKKDRYNSNIFFIDKLEVRSQGLFALMNEILDATGRIKQDKKQLAAGYNVVTDIGFYSTDIYITRALEHINFTTDKPLPGMSEVYHMLSNKITEQFGVRKRLYELEDNVISKHIKINGKAYGLSKYLQSMCRSLANNLIANIYNLVPNVKEVDNVILTGGGSIPLQKHFKKEFENVKVLDDPRMSNCRGGMKWAKRKW